MTTATVSILLSYVVYYEQSIPKQTTNMKILMQLFLTQLFMAIISVSEYVTMAMGWDSYVVVFC